METRVNQSAADAGRILTAAAALLVTMGLLLGPTRALATDDCPPAPEAAAPPERAVIGVLQNNIPFPWTTVDGDKQFVFAVPSGATVVTFVLHPTPPESESEFGYAFLYVNVPSKATWPTATDYSKCSEHSIGDNTAEFTRVSSPPMETGTYRVVVGKYAAGTVFTLTASYQSSSAGEIEILGMTHKITSGDFEPSTADGTEYGTVIMGEKDLQTFAIHNDGTEPLFLTSHPTVAISGANPGDFVVSALPGTRIEGGKSTSFVIQFKPSAKGTRTATVTVESDDLDNNPYTFGIRGFGSTKATHFVPETDDTGCALGAPATPAAAGAWYLTLALALLGAGLAGRRLARRPGA